MGFCYHDIVEGFSLGFSVHEVMGTLFDVGFGCVLHLCCYFGFELHFFVHAHSEHYLSEIYCFHIFFCEPCLYASESGKGNSSPCFLKKNCTRAGSFRRPSRTVGRQFEPCPCGVTWDVVPEQSW